ncbi:Hpt domain-containing protein [Alishewanella longhuensis]|nr:Hpt domain-containing protein [Alishewanella longhuensis]
MINLPDDATILDLDVLTAMYGDSSEETIVFALTGFYLAASGYMQDIQQAMKASNLTALAIAAHSLKGICGLVGAKPMAGLSNQLEHAARSGDTEQLQKALLMLPESWQLLQQQLKLVLKQ